MANDSYCMEYQCDGRLYEFLLDFRHEVEVSTKVSIPLLALVKSVVHNQLSEAVQRTDSEERKPNANKTSGSSRADTRFDPMYFRLGHYQWPIQFWRNHFRNQRPAAPGSNASGDMRGKRGLHLLAGWRWNAQRRARYYVHGQHDR